MSEFAAMAGGRLTGRTIAILMESDYVEPELDYYRRRFAEEGARVELLTRLWGQRSLTFTGHEYHLPYTVDGDLEAVDDERLRGYDALIVPSGMVSDRLRYSERVDTLAPAVRLLRRAFAEPGILKGIICHGMWLVSPIPEVVAGRAVTCHNNLISDVRNMGARYADQDVVVAGDLVTARSADHCHLFARTIIDLLAARKAGRDVRWWRSTVGSGGRLGGATGDTANGNGRTNGRVRRTARFGTGPVGEPDLEGALTNGNGNGNGASRVVALPAGRVTP